MKRFPSFFGTDYRFTVLNGVHVLVSFFLEIRDYTGSGRNIPGDTTIASDGIALKKDIASDIATMVLLRSFPLAAIGRGCSDRNGVFF